MNLDKKQKALFDAVSGIYDDLIDEAATPPNRVFPRRQFLRIGAIAAVLVLILTASLWPSKSENYVTAPGVLSIQAYAADENGNIAVEGVILENGVVFTPNIQYNPTVSYVQHFPISFTIDQSPYSGMDVTLEISTGSGIFYKNEPLDSSFLDITPIEQVLDQYYGQHFTVEVNKKIYWKPFGFDYDYLKQYCESGGTDLVSGLREFNFSHNPSFVDIIIRANDLIVGYCVMEIRDIGSPEDRPIQTFSFEVLTIVSFPKVDGYWQNVKESYILEQIQLLHNSREE